MLKRAAVLILIGVLCFSIFQSAQFAVSASGPSSVDWYQTFGGAGEEIAYSMIQKSDGGYVLVGSTKSLGVSTVLFVETDADGNMQWSSPYGRLQQPNGDLALSVIQASDGGYAFAGASWNEARGAHDLFLVKINAYGDMQWNLTYIRDTSGGSLDWGHAFSVIQTSDGGYMVGASVRHHPDHPTGDWDGWLVKTDADGTVQWDKPYGAGSDEGVHGVLQTGDGGYIFVGTTLSYGAGSGDVWLVKTDSSGNQQWAKTFGGSNWDDSNSITKTSDGGYIIGAATSSFGAGSWDFWLIKTDVNGNQQWNKTFGGANEDRAWSVIETTYGGYALAGSTRSFGAGDSDFWMVKTDSLGDQEWNATFGGANYDDARSIVQTVDKGYALAGYTDSFGAGSYDFLLIKLAPVSPRTIIVPDDYPTIQEAINTAWDGDTIFVRSGTYSHIDVSKSVNLFGEDKLTTIIDGSSYEEAAILVSASSVKISNFTIQNGKPDIFIGNRQPILTTNIAITDNIMKDSQEGVIRFICTSDSVLERNFINGSGAGGGINFDWGNDTLVYNNTVIQCWAAINGGYPSYNDTFQNNNFIDNDYYIFMNNVFDESRFFHNNFISNPLVHLTSSETCTWDNGYPSGGNYWSDYNETDFNCGPYQNETGSDGIGDTSYVIDANNTDHYPLMNPWTSPDIAVANLSTSKIIVGQGFPLNFSATIENLGNKVEAFAVDVYLNSSLLTSANYTLTSGNLALSAIWNTTGFAEGNYSLTMSVEPLQDEVNFTNNNMTAHVFITIPGDLNGDKTVDIYDAIILANNFGFDRYHVLWDPNIDINNDEIIDIYDALILAANYGRSWA